jgi:hypothetical protein
MQRRKCQQTQRKYRHLENSVKILGSDAKTKMSTNAKEVSSFREVGEDFGK